MEKIAELAVDDAFVVVDKPPGLVVIPARDGDAEDCVRARVERARGERLWVVHRLDRDTSGVLLFARTAEAHRALCAAFEGREAKKEYAVFCRSERVMSSAGTISVPLHPARKGKMRPALAGEQGALPCETPWERVRTAPTAIGPVARVTARPKTGRQHQIRVHLRSIDAPLAVDPLYGGASERAANALGSGSPPLSRLTLHATALSFPHPTRAGERVRVESALWPDLAALDAWLASREGAQS
jgi:tRNA pseudouridine32 synthase/23S rRNA pseudouridine746 synthase